MGRLIDADALKLQLMQCAELNNVVSGNAHLVCELIDMQPTAYDVDKVVEIVVTDDVAGKRFIKIVKAGGTE